MAHCTAFTMRNTHAWIDVDCAGGGEVPTAYRKTEERWHATQESVDKALVNVILCVRNCLQRLCRTRNQLLRQICATTTKYVPHLHFRQSLFCRKHYNHCDLLTIYCSLSMWVNWKFNYVPLLYLLEKSLVYAGDS